MKGRRGAGEPTCLGLTHRPRGGGAGSFSASPSANPVGRRRRLVPLTYTSKARPRTKLSAALGLAIAAALIAIPSTGARRRQRRRRDGRDRDAPRRHHAGQQGEARERLRGPARERAAQGRARDRGRQPRSSRASPTASAADTPAAGPLLRLLGLGQLRARSPAPGARLSRCRRARSCAGRSRGKGAWITTYANGGHMYAVIAGLRLDTSMTDRRRPGWSTEMRSGRGFATRHPARLVDERGGAYPGPTKPNS